MVKARSRSVNPQRWRGVLLAWLLAGIGAGCNTFSHYPIGMDSTTLAPLRRGEDTQYERTFRRRTRGKRDGVLFSMEKGRVAQLAGDVSVSREALAGAIDTLRAQEDRAVISARGAAAQTSAVLVNDKALPYRVPSYERTLIHHYQMLNYLAAGDLTGAGVEVRRANQVQEAARARREAEVNRARANAAQDHERDRHLRVVYAGLDELAGSVKHSFLNAATLYLSGVIWEMQGEPNHAYIDYKRALELVPENPFVQQDVIRLGKRLGMREDVDAFQQRFPTAADTPADGTGELAGKARLVVLYEEGLVPQKSEMSLAYPLFSADSIGVLALPVYAERVPGPVPVPVNLDGRTIGWTAPISNVAALAARALEEQMAGIVSRQVARAVAKGVAAKAARDQAGDFGSFVATLYNLFSEQADLRSWLSLPAHIQVLSVWVEPGRPKVALGRPGGGGLWENRVTLEAGKTTLVVVSRIQYAVYSQVIVQP